MGITYGTGERSRFGKPVLGMVMGPLLGMIFETTQGEELGDRGSGYGKSEDYCVGWIMLVDFFVFVINIWWWCYNC